MFGFSITKRLWDKVQILITPYLFPAIIVLLLVASPASAQYAYIELTWANGTFKYTTNNTNWSGTMHPIQSTIGTSIGNPDWNNCPGDVLVMPVGALVTSRHFYISETSNLLVRRGLTISSSTTSISVQLEGNVQDHFLCDFWAGTDEVSNTSRFLFGNENCLTGNLTVPGSWFTTSHRVQVRIGALWVSAIAGSAGGVKRVRLTFNGWVLSAPPAPSANAATNVTSSSFTANWSSSTSATGYRLDVATNSSFTNYVPGYQNRDVGNVTSYPVTGLSAGTTYYYRVRAYNSVDTSGNSDTISVTTTVNPPSAPTATAATSVTSNSFTANWNSVSGATGYRLDVATNSSFTNYVPGYQNRNVGNVTSYPVTGLSAGTTYYYRVRAYNSGGTSGNSNTITTTTLPNAPSAPTATSATNVTTSSFTANWNSVSGATGYRLDVATNSSFTNYVSGYQNLDVGNITSRNVTGLSAGTIYYYRVRAYNSGGTSSNSNTISITTTPSAPTATAATNVTSNGFTANWSSANGATGYRLDVATNSSFTNYVSGYQNLDVGNVTSRNVTGLNAGTTYYYRVRSYNSGGTSGNSNTISLTTTVNPPSAPTATAATNITNSSFTANWNSVSGATGYRLDVATNSSFTNYVSGYQNLDVGNVTSRSVTGLSAGTIYYYRVRAYNSGGTSGNSNTISVTTTQILAISGHVRTSEGTGISGVTMSGLPDNPSTDANGYYTGTVNYGWSGTVTPTKAGYSFSPPSTSYSNVTSNRTDNYTGTFTLQTFTISGHVRTSEGTGISGVTMSALPGNPSTDANGYYTGTVDYGWSGTVTPTKAGYSFSPPSTSYSNVTSNQTTNYTATIQAFTISGYVRTSGGTGISDVMMSGLPDNPSTDANGYYTGTVDYGWSGTVTPTKAGYSFSPPSTSYSNVTSNQTTNYTATIQAFTISGYVRTSGGTGISDVMMSGLPDNPSTDANGYYTGTVNYGWSGTVTPTKAGYSFSPPSTSYSNVTSNRTDNYTGTFTLQTFTISGHVRTSEGTGISGVTMSALPGNPSTDANGYYTGTVDYGWSGTVTPIKEGYTFSPSSTSYSNVTSNRTTNYTGALQTLTISGHVRTSEGTGISGVLMSGLPGNPSTDEDGYYTGTVDYGWSGTVTPTKEGYTFSPSSTSYSNVTSNRTTNYTGAVMGLQVTLTPQEAVEAGAKWRVDGGEWQDSGTTVTGVSIGEHEVEYKAIAGWNAPPDETVTIFEGQTTQITRTYTIIQTGNLKVTLGPEEAVNAGAQWNVDEGAWHNSGETVSGLSVGEHTINYKIISGWIAPQNEIATINYNLTTQISREYTLITGNIYLILDPSFGSSGNNITISIDISDNNQDISAFGLELIYDSTSFVYKGVEKGSLTSDWSLVEKNEIEPGKIKIDGCAGGGTIISPYSNGNLVKLKMQVRCLGYDEETIIQLKIENYADGISNFLPHPCTADFTFMPCPRLGDVNGDGEVTPADALQAFEIYLVKIIPSFCQETTSNANCDESTTPGDAQDIFDHYMEKKILPKCCAETTGNVSPSSLGVLKDEKKLKPSERKIYALDTICKSGEIVNVPIIITNPEGISSFGFGVNYFPELLEFIGLKRSPLTREFEYVRGIKEVEGLIRIEGESQTPIKSNKYGSLAVMVFKVKKGINDSLPITIFNQDKDLFRAEVNEAIFTGVDYFKDEARFLSFGEAIIAPDKTIRIPVEVSNAFNLKAFGMDLRYSTEKMLFIGVNKGALTKDFMALEGNELEEGIVRIGGYSLSGVQEEGPGVLFELVFFIKEKGEEVEIIKLVDDIKNYVINKGNIEINKQKK